MRLVSLHLDRYGAFTDRRLDFDENRSLTVIHGANEAGKSTALSALSDAFFGFPKDSPYAFLHDYGALRVGATVKAPDGRTLTFRRRKGNKATLLDETDQPIPDDALEPFLGAVDRALFQEAFALDQPRLRRGAERLLAGDGTLGEALLAAAPGLGAVVDVRRRTMAEAGALFDPARRLTTKPLYAAVSRWEAARKAVRDESLTADTVRKAKARLDDAGAAVARLEAERKALRTEAERIRRRRAVLPLLKRIAALEAEAPAFADLRPLPPHFRERLAEIDAETERATALRDQRLQDLARTRASLDGIAVDEAVLAEAPAIEPLAADRRTREQAASDLAEEEARRAAAERGLAEEARRLGISDVADLVHRQPTAILLGRARALIARHRDWSAAAKAAKDALASAERTLDALVETDPEAPSGNPAEHRAVLDRLAELQPAVRMLEERTSARREAEAAFTDALRAAVLSADRAALRARRLPSRTATEQAGLAAADLERAIGLASRARDEATARLQEIERRLSGLGAAGPIASDAAVAAARETRESIWVAIRARLFGEAEATASERLALAHSLETATAEADRLADRRLREADRIALSSRLEEEHRAATAALSAAESGLSDALARRDAAAGRWADHVAKLGLPDADPKAVIEAIERHEEALRRLAALETEERACEAAAATVAKLGQSLAGLCEGLAIPFAAEDLLATLARARTAVHAEEEKARLTRDRATARRSAETHRLTARTAVEDLTAAGVALADERRSLAPSLGLPTEATADDLDTALSVWAAVDAHLTARNDAEARIARAGRTIAAFDAEADRLAATLAPDLAALPAIDRVRRLAERLAEARSAAERRRALANQRATLEADLETAQSAIASAERTRTRLLEEIGLAPDGDVPAYLAAHAAAETLRSRLDEVRTSLATESAGTDEAQLAEELSSADPDELAAEAAGLADRLDVIDAEHQSAVAARTEAEAAYREVIGREGADALGQAAENELATVVRIAEDWTLLQAASRLAGAVVEEFRKRHQSPVLSDAGRLMATLTGDRYTGLAADYDEDGKVRLVALRDDGRRLDPRALSEGTRDQLYLALRLATLRDHARRTASLPFVGDDHFVTFDEARTRRGLLALADFGATAQVLVFTHHVHVVEIARETLGDRAQVITLDRP